ncbi:MAG: DNA polymerase III subunit delta [Methylococcus sp.]|nr:MAG: DNA polymerase III subunit delta [Methylococcus sp.]
MRLSAEQIGRNLGRRLLPVYLVCGDEPLQHGETRDAIRQACKVAGYSTRELFDVEPGFHWENFEFASQSLSLFSEKRILELRFGANLPDKKAAQYLQRYLERLPGETILLASCGKLAKTTPNTAWFKTLDRLGAVVQVHPLQRQRFLGWLDARAKSREVTLERQALAVLAGRVEGNMLAAAQEIDKLRVLYGSARLDVQTVEEVVLDSAHFNVFDLVDGVLAGKAARISRVLCSIREEGLAYPLVLWALARELRLLASMRYDLDRGTSRALTYRNHRVWESRQGLFDAALRRLDHDQIQVLVARCVLIDRVGKGLFRGDVWNELLQLCLAIAGCSVLSSPDGWNDAVIQ